MHYYHRYLSGEYLPVYDELMGLDSKVYDEPYHQDAWLIALEMMKRVRLNIETLVPRLHAVGYRFGEGLYDDLPDDQRREEEKYLPVCGIPTQSTKEHITLIEHHKGPLLARTQR